jgi:seryl-tRNA(Sec) selenium transferase
LHKDAMMRPPWERLPHWAAQNLEHLTDRIDPAELASEARKRLQQLAHDLPEMAGKLPEVAGKLPELAAKGADQVLRNLQQFLPTGEPTPTRSTKRGNGRPPVDHPPAVLNASGIAFLPAIVAAPAPAIVIDDLASSMAGFRERRDDVKTALEQALAKALQSASACVAQRPAAAMVALGAALAARGCTALISRQWALDWDGGIVPDLLRAGGATVREFGTTAGPQTAALRTALQRVVGPSAYIAMETAAAASDCREYLQELRRTGDQSCGAVILIDDSLDPLHRAASDRANNPFASTELHAPAVRIIVPQRSSGGPTSAVMAGAADWIASVRSTELWPALEADDLTQRGLLAICQLYAAERQADVPLSMLARITAENLALRGELIRDQLATLSGWSVRLTHAVARFTSQAGERLPSCQVRLAPLERSQADEPLESARRELADGFPRLLTLDTEREIVVDLRWIAPSHDRLIVARLRHALGAQVGRPGDPSGPS